MTASTSEKAYFDLHISGLGYVNRVRTVKPKRGEPFLACNISALTGPRNDLQYCYFDVKVSGEDAQRLIRKSEDAVEAGCKVLIGFKLGDPWLDIWPYKEGHPKYGQTGVTLKARLLKIFWMNIDGVRVYTAEPKSTNGARNENDAVPAADPPQAPASEPSEEIAEALPMAASA